jgi:hypothetical protein
MKELIDAIKEQTEAINALADSNMALVACLVDEQADEEDQPPRFMDGTPCR